ARVAQDERLQTSGQDNTHHFRPVQQPCPDLTIDRELHEVRCRPPREYRKTREMGEPFCQRVRVDNVTTAVQHETRPCSRVRFPRDFPKVRTADLLSTLNRTHWFFAGHPAREVAGLLLIARST